VTTPAAIHAADERLQTILKAHVVGATVQDPASRPAGEDTAAAFTSAGALIPPYDPETLCLLVEHSNSLRQNVDAYATNIDGNGYRFDAVIDFDAEDARSKVADAITLERLAAREARTLPEGMSTTPSAEEVSARFTELRQAARVERARLDAFFDFACFDHSFVDLRRRTRQDLEVTGNAFWEVLRDGKGDLARLVYVPSYTVRLLPLDREAVEVTERARVSPVSFDTVRSRRRMRRYVQVQSTECVYFKSFGDPRVCLALDGPRLRRHRRAQGCQARRRPRDGAAPLRHPLAALALRRAALGGHAALRPRLAADGGGQLPLLREQVGAADGAPRVGRAHLRGVGAAHRALHRGEPQGQGELPQDPHPRGGRRGHR
jgi:hypothetical protein